MHVRFSSFPLLLLAACASTEPPPAAPMGATVVLATPVPSANVAPHTDAPAQPTPRRALLSLSKADHTLAIVDPATLKVIARMPVGPDPHEVIASADGKTAYVSNTGSGKFHEIDVIDLVAQKALPSLDTGALIGPHGLTFVGGKVWFTAEGAKSVARFDPATAKFDWILGTGQNRTHMLYVTPDETRIYTTNVDSGTVSLLESVTLPPNVPPTGVLPTGAAPHQEWVETVIPVAKGNEGFDLSPDGRELWAAAAADGTVSIVDLAARKVSAVIDAKALGANRLKFAPDGKHVLVSTLRGGDLVVIDTATHKETKRVPLGHGCAGLLVDAEGNRAFAGCTADDYVAVIDLATLTVSGHLDTGGHPDGLAWAARP